MSNIGTDGVTERELKAKLERFTGLENYSAWLIVAALLLEAVFVWRFSDGKSWLETSLFIMADLPLAAGVWGEIHWGRKAHAISAQLQQASDQRVAEAEARAAEANRKASEAALSVERFRAPNTRRRAAGASWAKSLSFTVRNIVLA
jgi:hypothetical protein